MHSVNINTQKTKPPVSKYIYGQFIEHLGRCIYGGTWAEMIEDRKFYYPVTDDYNPWATASDAFITAGEYKYLNASPWKVIGPAGSVRMETTDPYVGEHSPVIRLSNNRGETGISQEGLGIVEGKRYTGRIVLAGDSESTPVVVRLVLDDSDIIWYAIHNISQQFEIYSVEFEAPRTSENVRIEIISQGTGTFKIGTLSLMPDDNINGWRKDVLELMKELDSPVYRWPGGNFVSGYNWRDGIGKRDKRPPRKNPAWKGIEHNDVGIHEYMDLVKLLDTEPFITVNTGLGSVEDAAAEVEYCNGSADTPMGKLRAENGHPEPYRVKWWCVGNEMWSSIQLGHMPLAEYVKKHNQAAEAMIRVDSSIKLVGVGLIGDWSEQMFVNCSDHMDLISEHFYCQEKEKISEHILQLPQKIREITAIYRKYYRDIPELKGKNIPVAMDEWNYWYGDYIFGELGCRYRHKDAVGIALGLHEYFRNSDLYFMANYAQTVNVIGCIKTTTIAAGFATTAMPLILYRKHFGSIPVEISGNAGDLDISAALTHDKHALIIAIVNSGENSEQVSFRFANIQFDKHCTKWMIHHDDPQIYNEPDKEPHVKIVEQHACFTDDAIEIPAYAIVMYRLEIK